MPKLKGNFIDILRFLQVTVQGYVPYLSFTFVGIGASCKLVQGSTLVYKTLAGRNL